MVMPREGTYTQRVGLIPIDRGPAQNDVGIVAWLLTMRTPESPQGRQVHHQHQTYFENMIDMTWPLYVTANFSSIALCSNYIGT